METINCLGEVCPLPVIKTKKALKNHDSISVLVDNDIATQNLNKMAQQLGYICHIKQLKEKEYQVIISKTDQLNLTDLNEGTIDHSDSHYIVVISDNKMGNGSDELGKILLKGFLYALSEQDILPKAILFYNAGVQLTLEESDALIDLKTMHEAGVEILSCGLCLDYYQKTDALAVGEITNMYHILEMMRTYHNVKPS